MNRLKLSSRNYLIVLLSMSLITLSFGCSALRESESITPISRLRRTSSESKVAVALRTSGQKLLEDDVKKLNQEKALRRTDVESKVEQKGQGIQLPCASLLERGRNGKDKESNFALFASFQESLTQIWDKYSPLGVESATALPCMMSEGSIKPFNSANLDLVPKKGGIYAIYDDDKELGFSVAYIGKADKNIQQRLKKHLSGRGSKIIKIMLENNHKLTFSFGYSDNPKGAEAAELARLSPFANRKREIRALED